MRSVSPYTREITKYRKFEELSDGDVFIFPGDRRVSVKDTGFVKIGGNQYARITEFRTKKGETVNLNIIPETEVLPIKGISTVSRN
ncbi:MAG: hypothetical protein V2I97_14910 [Desulfococcaceae bacterium]|jgi:hypothetical protein|nr:hypothetical protein [Desulfococcaceae bacterium]